MKSKKGAIELSMTTIIVIVIGVTLLILGITFVRTIFTKITAISENTFDEAQDLLEGIEDVNQFLTINPNVKDIEQNSDGVIKVTIANFEEENIQITAKASTKDEDLVCVFLTEDGSLEDSTGPYTIKSGGQKGLVLIIQDTGGPLRTTGCSVKIEGAPEGEDSSGSVVVRVKKAQKLF